MVTCVVWSQVLYIPSLAPELSQTPDTTPYPRISEEAFKARLGFFSYDPSIPLDARVVREWDTDSSLRQKIVFRGAQGFWVPGYLEFPKHVTAPHPLVLLLHGWSGNKEQWYEDHNIISGGPMRKTLLTAGYAVLTLDAATHGERSHEIDFQHVNAFNDPLAPPTKNYFTFSEIAVQTVKDYRRALDYLKHRNEIDLSRVGLVGYSMGGMMAFYLLSVEPRIKAAAACVPPLYGQGYDPTAPIDYTWGIHDTPLLLLMGRQDKLYIPAKAEASFRAYLDRPNVKTIWYDKGHELTDIYVPDALRWIQEHVKR